MMDSPVEVIAQTGVASRADGTPVCVLVADDEPKAQGGSLTLVSDEKSSAFACQPATALWRAHSVTPPISRRAA